MEAAFAEAQPGQPRNLYLVGIFVADHQLPEPVALPAPEEPTAVQSLSAPPEPAAAETIVAIQPPQSESAAPDAAAMQPAALPLPPEPSMPMVPLASAESSAICALAAPPAAFVLPPPDQPASAAPAVTQPVQQLPAAAPSSRADSRRRSKNRSMVPAPLLKPSQEPAKAAATGAAVVLDAASPQPRSDLQVMQYLVHLLARPPGYIDMEDPRLHGLEYTGLPPEEADRQWKHDMASLLLSDTIGPRKVIVLHPQVNVRHAHTLACT